MATIQASPSSEIATDVPFDTYAFLETRMQTLRMHIVKEAAKLIRDKGDAEPGKPIKVSRQSVRDALTKLLGDPEKLRKILQD